ncbi:MAG: F0F1 ATP synthase subunit A [Planctomycetota bacterium]
MAKDALAAETLFEHVQDAPYFHFPRFFAPDHDGHLFLPQPLARPALDEAGNPLMGHHGEPLYTAIWAPDTGNALVDRTILPLDLVFTKFMAIELAVALICVLLFGWLAAQIRGGRAAKGRLANLLEVFVVYIRDNVAKTAIGDHGYEKFTPLLCTLFFFVLGCNLFGMLPWMGSPTGVLAVTAALALSTFLIVAGAGIAELGFVGFLAAQAPSMDLPPAIKVVLLPLIWVIEVFSLFLKHIVLAIRLLANMVAGHLILAVLIGFIGAAGTYGWFAVGGIAPVSIAGAVAISVLELFVAFLQAYVFTFLSALFIGAAVHPH